MAACPLLVFSNWQFQRTPRNAWTRTLVWTTPSGSPGTSLGFADKHTASSETSKSTFHMHCKLPFMFDWFFKTLSFVYICQVLQINKSHLLLALLNKSPSPAVGQLRLRHLATWVQLTWACPTHTAAQGASAQPGWTCTPTSLTQVGPLLTVQCTAVGPTEWGITPSKSSLSSFVKLTLTAVCCRWLWGRAADGSSHMGRCFGGASCSSRSVCCSSPGRRGEPRPGDLLYHLDTISLKGRLPWTTKLTDSLL